MSDEKTYEDEQVQDGTDKLAQGHGEPPEDTAGVTGGVDADPDPNPAFHGADQAQDTAADLPEHTAYEEGATET